MRFKNSATIQVLFHKVKKNFKIPLLVFCFIWVGFFILYQLLRPVDATIRLGTLVSFISVSFIILFAYTLLKMSLIYFRSYNKLLKNATLDDLTGLCTHKLFMHKYNEISDNNKDWVIALVVINGSHTYRDLFGFYLYKEHLIEVGRILTEFAGPSGTAVYLNAGRFVMLCPTNSKRELVVAQLHTHLNNFSSATTFQNSNARNFVRTYSAGLYFLDGTVVDIEDPLCSLKEFLYQQDHTNVTDYTQQINTLANSMRIAEPHIKQAFEKDEFKIVCQPRYSVDTKNMAGGELFRYWEHEEIHMKPQEFLPVLQRTGEISTLDLAMVKSACDTMKLWVDNKIPPIPISINLSKHTALNKNFITDVTQLLTHYSIPTSLIELEIDQASLIDVGPSFIKAVQELSAMGFSPVLDNVDGRNNIIELIRRIDIKIVKLSKEFFDYSNEREKKFIISTINFCNSLNIQTIAKDVETRAHLLFAQECGCDIFQGNLLCKSIPIESFLNRILTADSDVAFDI